MRAREEAAAAGGGDEANPNMIAVGARVPAPQEERRKEPIPNVEWWWVYLFPFYVYRIVLMYGVLYCPDVPCIVP